MKPPMLNTAYKVTTTRNEYGDYIAGAEIALACHFRQIIQIGDESSNEQADTNGMAWFEPDAGIETNDILKIDGQHYKVDRVTSARKLHSANVQFLKVELNIYGLIS